jgi:glycosyltransferase involved in cell wall biosynthesis
VGFVNQAELPRTYQLADFLVLPSESETWGLVVNEAMLCGLPAIVIEEAGCTPELISRSGVGRSFPSGDVPALAEQMREVIEMASERRAAWRDAARRTAMETSVVCVAERMGAVLGRECS